MRTSTSAPTPRALGRIAPEAPETRVALRRATQDPEETVRVQALEALDQTAEP